MRAVRLDKMTLAALEATLRLHLEPGTAAQRIPALRMLGQSEAALQARAERVIARDPLADRLAVEFRLFDSITLPLDDHSVDRIVSFDAFHHVRDQEATLREMARVLRPGGIVAFHEPGPRHSLTPMAQSEMRDFDVIENDIDLRRIWAMAESFGFAHIWISLPSIHAPIVGLDQLDRVAAGVPSHDDVERIVQTVHNFAHNLRIFSLHKRGLAEG